MSTQSWSTRLRHDSDAVFWEWRDELITKLGLLVAAGDLAADETNITPGSGARPATNTEQGYAVYHLDDSLHGTAPVYIRFGFGTGGNASQARIQVTVGTSTNGSGVLGGTALSTIASIAAFGNTAQTTDTARTSYMCATDGFFGLAWKTGNASAEGFFFIARTVDSAGAISATGAIAAWGSTATNGMTKTQAFRYAATAAAYTAQTIMATQAMCINPQAPTATTVGSDFQAMLAWTLTPAVAPIVGVCGVSDTEVPQGNTFTATLVGATSHTYLGVSTASGPVGGIATTSAGGLKPAMLWE